MRGTLKDNKINLVFLFHVDIKHLSTREQVDIALLETLDPKTYLVTGRSKLTHFQVLLWWFSNDFFLVEFDIEENG